MTPQASRGTVLVVGSGWRFTSGISYYTCRLTNALAGVVPTRAILMRGLVPRILYPGRNRVGQVVNDLGYDPGVEVLDGVDWFWGASMVRAWSFIRKDPPAVLVLQWWTGAVLHTYLLLTLLARRRGARVIMEWHEVQDTGEARIPGVTRYVRMLISTLLRRVDAHVVHSSYDLELLESAYQLDRSTVTIIPHGPYDHVAGQDGRVVVGAAEDALPDARPAEPETPFTILYFGVIRPYKGLEDLVAAFDLLPPALTERLRLLVVGETWEGWDAPLRAIEASPNSARITVVNRYVSDAEVREFFGTADAAVLPYRRSSSSGPLHIAMSVGLPVVVTSVGGLLEAAGEYAGVVFVPPQDPPALAEALAGLPALRGTRYPDPHSWDVSVERYMSILHGWQLPAEPSEPAEPAVTGGR